MGTDHGNTTVGKGRADAVRSVLKLGGESSDSTEEAGQDKTSDPELGTATDLVISSRTSNSARAGNDRVGKGQQQTTLNRNDTEKLVHGGQIVRQDRVSRQLCEEGHEGHHGESPAGVVVLDQRPVVPDAGRLL